MILKEDYDLSAATTFRLPARARYYAEYASVDELRKLLAMPELRGLPVLHIGAGSNLLFTRDFPGLVLRSAIKGIYIEPIIDYHWMPGYVLATAGAGETWDDFVAATCREWQFGLENLSLIPGTVGAAAVQNIGAYGVELSDILLTVNAYDTVLDREVTLRAESLHYGYRHSLFKEPEMAGRYVVTSIAVGLHNEPKFTLDYGPLRELKGRVDLTPEMVRQRVIELRRSKLPDPDELGSAGSFFMNPMVEEAKYRELLAAHPDMPGYPQADGQVKLSAGWLIEHAGLKGASVGGAMVYPRQCLVIVNTGGATSNDVVDLAKKVQDEVADKYGVTLSPEVVYV